MSGQNVSALELAALGLAKAKDPRRFEQPEYIKALCTASGRALHLGICVLDSQTRFESVNAAMAYETRASVDQHIGKTAREIVGDLADQVEPAFESVLRTGDPETIWLAGRVRDTLEFGHWLDYCFPIRDQSARVQQLGVFVVNVTAEKESTELFNALAFESNFLTRDSSSLIKGLDEAIQGYHLGLKMSLEELCSPAKKSDRKVDHFRSSLQRLDSEVRLMRELIRTVIDRLPIPAC